MSDKISGKIINIYEGIGNSSDDGRGPNHVTGWYLTPSEAKFGVKTSGSFGSEGSYRAVSAIKIEDGPRCGEYFLITPIILSSFDKDEIKKAALSKLTDLEQEVLGLKK